MTDTVAGVGRVGVGGVLAPGLVAGAEEGFNLGAARGKQGAKDLSGALVRKIDLDDGMDGAKSLGPGSAKELHQDGLGLIVEGVGGEDGVGVAGGKKGAEEGVACLAGGFFDGFAVLGGAGGDVAAMDVEWDVELDAEVLDKGEIGVGLSGLADAMVNVNCGEPDAERVARRSVGFVQGEQERDGIGASGDCDTDAVAGTKVFAVEGKWCGCRHRVIHVNGLRAC